jgi:hypothetical protein
MSETLTRPKPLVNKERIKKSASVNGSANKGAEQDNINKTAFYKPKYKDGKVVDITILYIEFIELLRLFGFRLYNNDEPFIFVKITDNVIEEVSISQIQSHFIDFVKHKHKTQGDVKREMILEKFYKNPSHYFNAKRLSLLYPQQPIKLNADTEKECFLYFKNGFVKCTSKGFTFHNYKELKGAIWLKQKQNRDFKNLDWIKLDEVEPDKLGYFYQFMYYISGSKESRLYSLFSIVGYLLHSYFEYKLKAPIFTDSKITDKPDGRTGKTLFCKALGHIRNYIEINGKDFDPTNKHKYQSADLGTQIVCLNDVKRNFDPETIFNDITEGVQVEKKNQQPFTIRAKTIVTTNKTIRMDGSSSKDRFIEFEFANHFSDKYSPKDAFGHWFFTEWNIEEWNKFDNLMAFCACYFLKNGIIVPEPINLPLRQVVDMTSTDFVSFLDEQFEQKNIEWNVEFDIDMFFNDFFENYKEYLQDRKYSRAKNRKIYLEGYCNAKGGKYEFRRSNNKNLVTFRKIE